jgi:hypothetical protein
MMARLHIRPASDQATSLFSPGVRQFLFSFSSSFTGSYLQVYYVRSHLHPSHALTLHGSLDQSSKHTMDVSSLFGCLATELLLGYSTALSP